MSHFLHDSIFFILFSNVDTFLKIFSDSQGKFLKKRRQVHELFFHDNILLIFNINVNIYFKKILVNQYNY